MRGMGLTTPAEAVATVGPADTDDVDRALDFALDFHQIEMYFPRTLVPFACIFLALHCLLPPVVSCYPFSI